MRRTFTLQMHDVTPKLRGTVFFPCGECAIETVPTHDPEFRICPACMHRGHAHLKRTAACKPHPTRSVALARREPWGPLRSCQRCDSSVMGHYDFCESCILDMRPSMAFGAHGPPMHYNARCVVRPI